ncbi:hypothetical protein KW794_02290, partial [Candidatus Saccharibacteria bacterium]|nr:hypothetical protein [Candidatus Saccharibacteria bacterium]
MQGDIMLPTPKHKAASKPKPANFSAEPRPDFVINESNLKPRKQRKVFVAPHKHFKRFWRWWLSLGRNERFAVIAAMLLIFAAGAIGWFYFIQPKPDSKLLVVSSHHKAKPKPPPTTP